MVNLSWINLFCSMTSQVKRLLYSSLLRPSKQKLSIQKHCFWLVATQLVLSRIFCFGVFWCFSKLGSLLTSVLVCRKRKTVYGGCSFASEENICWSCKAANIETFRASSGDYALVYSQWNWKSHTCCPHVDSSKLQADEIFIKSICCKSLYSVLCLHKTVREISFLFKGLPDSGHDQNS